MSNSRRLISLTALGALLATFGCSGQGVSADPAEDTRTSSFSLATAPTIGADFALDSPVLSSSSAAVTQEAPAIACGASQCLAVWNEPVIDGYAGGIFAARINLDGSLVDSVAIPVALEVGKPRPTLDHAAVAWDGSRWLVVWHHGDSSNPAAGELRSAFLNSAGTLSPNEGSLGGNSARVACDQGRCLVATHDNSYLRVYQLAASGASSRVWDAERRTGDIFHVPVDVALAAAPNGGGFMAGLVTNWRDAAGLTQSQALVWRLDQEGKPLHTDPLLVAANTRDMHGNNYDQGALAIDIAHCGGAWAVVNSLGPTASLTDGLSAVQSAVTQIALDGTLGTSSALFSSSTSVAADVAIAGSSDGCVVLHDTSPPSTTVVARKLDRQGLLVTGSADVATATNTISKPALANQGSNFYATYALDGRVTSRRLLSSLTAFTPVALSTPVRSNRETLPAIASGSRGALVAWEDTRSESAETSDIYATRLDVAGQVIDAPALALSHTAGRGANPQVTSLGGGDTYLAVWQGIQDSKFHIMASRVSATADASSAVLDRAGIPIIPGTTPAVASNGTSYFVVASNGSALTGAGVSADGQLLSASPVALGTGTQPALAFNGSNYLLAYENSNDVYAVRLALDGAKVGSSVALARTALAENHPAVASDGSHWLVVHGGSAVTAYLTSADFVDISPIPVSSRAASYLTVAWDGQQYWVVGHDGTDGSTFTRRLDAAGQLLDGEDINIPAFRTTSERCGVAGLGAGIAAVVYADQSESIQGGPSRIRARMLRNDASGTGGTTAAGGTTGAGGGSGISGGASGSGPVVVGGTGGRNSGAGGQETGGKAMAIAGAGGSESSTAGVGGADSTVGGGAAEAGTQGSGNAAGTTGSPTEPKALGGAAGSLGITSGGATGITSSGGKSPKGPEASSAAGNDGGCGCSTAQPPPGRMAYFGGLLACVGLLARRRQKPRS